MKRAHLEHVLRAASTIANTNDFVVIGSNAVLATVPHALATIVASIDADVFSLSDPAAAELVDGSIGELSPFHRTYGYYAHGVGIETAILPRGWRERLVPVTSGEPTREVGRALEMHDLAVSKLAAGRQKDIAYVRALLTEKYVDADQLRVRASEIDVDTPLARHIAERLERIVASLHRTH